MICVETCDDCGGRVDRDEPRLPGLSIICDLCWYADGAARANAGEYAQGGAQ